MSLVRSMWRRKSWPRPAPLLAPSIRPGMSAIRKRRKPAQFHDAENGLQRRKRVRGNLGPGRRRAGEQGALAGVGHADQPHVGDELELQAEVSLLAELARLELARGLVRGGGKGPVASAAFAAPADQDLHPRFVEVFEQEIEVGVVDQGARRDGNDQVLAVLAVHVLPLAVLASLGVPVVLAGKIQERVLVGPGLEVHVPAVAAVAAVRSPFGDELLPAEAHASVAAVAGLHVDFGFIDKHNL